MEEIPNKPPGMYNTLVNNVIFSYLLHINWLSWISEPSTAPEISWFGKPPSF